MAYLPGVIVTVLAADLGSESAEFAWCVELRVAKKAGDDQFRYEFGTATGGSFVAANTAAIEHSLSLINTNISERVAARRAAHKKIGTTQYFITLLVHPKSVSAVHTEFHEKIVELSEVHGHRVRLGAFASVSRRQRTELAKYIAGLNGENVEQTEIPF
jgi:hypothetical protein